VVETAPIEEQQKAAEVMRVIQLKMDEMDEMPSDKGDGPTESSKGFKLLSP
jgi:hypothetical protein